MKNTFIILLSLIVSLACLRAAEPLSPVEKLYEKYHSNKGITTVNINKELFDMLKGAGGGNVNIEGMDSADLGEIIGPTTSIKVITCSQDEAGKLCDEFYKDIKELIPFQEYKELMSVEDDGTNVKMLSKNEGDKIKEFLILVREPDQVVLVSFNGLFDKHILGKMMNMLQNKEKKKYEIKKENKAKNKTKKSDED